MRLTEMPEMATKFAFANNHNFRNGGGTSTELHLAGQVGVAVADAFDLDTEELTIAGHQGIANVTWAGTDAWPTTFLLSTHARELKEAGIVLKPAGADTLAAYQAGQDTPDGADLDDDLLDL